VAFLVQDQRDPRGDSMPCRAHSLPRSSEKPYWKEMKGRKRKGKEGTATTPETWQLFSLQFFRNRWIE
jgi:hypothetical protein